MSEGADDGDCGLVYFLKLGRGRIQMIGREEWVAAGQRVAPGSRDSAAWRSEKRCNGGLDDGRVRAVCADPLSL